MSGLVLLWCLTGAPQRAAPVVVPASGTRPASEEPLKSPVLADAPLVPILTPPPPAPQPAPAVRASTSPAALKVTLAAAAVTAAGVSVGYLVTGLGTRSALTNNQRTTPDGMRASGFTATQAERLAAQSNFQLSLSLFGAVIAGVFTLAATYFFVTE